MSKFFFLNRSRPNSVLSENNYNYFYLCFILLTVPLILNGYPILFSDSATYIGAYTSINSIFGPPISRPISYGVFLFIASIGKSSLFFVALFQDALMAYLITKLLNLTKSQNFSLIFLFLYLPISYVAVLTNTILTDIWLGMGYLSAYILIFTNNKKSPLYYFVLFLSGAFAPANGIIIFISTFLLWPIMRFKKSKEILLISLSIISSLLLLSYDNYISHNSFSPIAGSNTFWVGRLIGDGLAQKTINDLCAKPQYKETSPCINRYQYINRTGQNFLWGNYKNNFSPWNLKYSSFFSDVKFQTLLHNPTTFTYKVFQRGIYTLLILPDNLNQIYGRYNGSNSDNWVYRTIRMYFNYHQMVHAWQQISQNSFNYFPTTNIGILVVFILTLAANIMSIQKNFRRFMLLTFYTLSFVLLNAFIDGVFLWLTLATT